MRHTQDRGGLGGPRSLVWGRASGEVCRGSELVAELPVERAALLVRPGCAGLEQSLSVSMVGVRGAWGQGQEEGGRQSCLLPLHESSLIWLWQAALCTPTQRDWFSAPRSL